jgi:hypothetical protein
MWLPMFLTMYSSRVGNAPLQINCLFVTVAYLAVILATPQGAFVWVVNRTPRRTVCLASAEDGVPCR